MRVGWVVGALCACVASWLVTACGNAPDSVQGGEALFPAPVDCTPSAALCGTWTHMYGCYFGPQAANSGCAGQGGVCHAASGEDGVEASGFVCGTSQASCYEGMLSPSASLVLADSKSSPGLNSAVYKAGSTAGTKSNNMPTSSFGGPPYVSAAWKGFTPADLQCVKDWVNAGAPNN